MADTPAECNHAIFTSTEFASQFIKESQKSASILAGKYKVLGTVRSLALFDEMGVARFVRWQGYLNIYPKKFK